MPPCVQHLTQNFRFGPLSRQSYASPALGTTNLPTERILARSAGSQRLVLAVWQFFRAHLDKSYSRHVGASYREDRLSGLGRLGSWTPGSEQCLRNRSRGSKGGSSDGKGEPSEPRDLAVACSVGKFVVPRAGEAYEWRDRGPNRKFRLRCYIFLEMSRFDSAGETMPPGTTNSTVLAGTAQASGENTLLYCYNTCPPDQ